MSEETPINEEKIEEIKEKVGEILIPQGKDCGQEIAGVLRDRGHDQVVPLYRSAVTLEVKKSEEGIPYISIESYDDPRFWGAAEISDETVKDEGREYIIRGGRSGISICDALEGEMMSRAAHKRIEETRTDNDFSELLEQVADMDNVSKLKCLKDTVEGKIQCLESQESDC